MIGTRRDDVEHLGDLAPGEYARRSEGMVWLCLPNGEHVALPIGDGRWIAFEEGDGTLTLSPSIDWQPVENPRVERDPWHGWLRAGVWSEA